MHAITTVVRKWRQYLLGHSFVILTDHKSLKELMSQIIQTPKQQVYLSKLLGYNYFIQYKIGKSNLVADALSRISDTQQGHYFVVSLPNFTILDALRNTLYDSDAFKTLLQQVQTDPSSHPDFKLHNSKFNPFRSVLMEEYHKTPLGDHMGFAKTLHRLHENFYWPTMRKEVKQFVQQCITC